VHLVKDSPVSFGVLPLAK